MTRFVFTVALGAVLLFLVQPMVARAVLPWFGGSAAVWTTCQLFFQVLLLAGYGWTHGLVRRLAPRRQVHVQVGLIAAATLGLLVTAVAWGSPVIPGLGLRPTSSDAPVPRLLLTLLLAVGLPYFALATTGPLLQAWASKRSGVNVYRLYAVSNAGSLLGLLLYPFALEPLTTLRVQGWLWGAGFLAWGVGLTLASRGVSGDVEVGPTAAEKPRWARWLTLSATPVVLLLAVTNHLTQEVAPIPFLWVLPLVAYLASFIVTFESERWYRRAWALPVLAALSLGIAALRSVEQELPLPLRVLLFIAFLFVACVAAHGELAASRPSPAGLTGFYAALALGGALGGVFVGLVAPAVFSSFVELELGLVALLIVLAVVLRGGRGASLWWLLVGLVGVLLLVGHSARQRGVLAARRDFFGVVRVVASGEGDDEANLLMHGRTVHGAQQVHHREAATTYYAPESGVGRLLSLERAAPRRVGVIGLGIGTLAAYGRAGDTYRFYEISPTVVSFAKGEGGFFTFLGDSKAQTSVALGDARTVLEGEAPNGFDVLVLDAFSSDSVPVHLLTREAMALYVSHLAPGGVLALHLSNRSLSLIPVAARVGREVGLIPAVIGQKATSSWALPSRWLVLARDASAFEGLPLTDASPPSGEQLWTDDFSSLWRAVQW